MFGLHTQLPHPLMNHLHHHSVFWRTSFSPSSWAPLSLPIIMVTISIIVLIVNQTCPYPAPASPISSPIIPPSASGRPLLYSMVYPFPVYASCLSSASAPAKSSSCSFLWLRHGLILDQTPFWIFQFWSKVWLDLKLYSSKLDFSCLGCCGQSICAKLCWDDVPSYELHVVASSGEWNTSRRLS